MKKTRIIYLALFSTLFVGVSCESTSKTMKESSAEINESNTGRLIHCVYFQLRPDAEKQTLITSLKTFEGIEVVKNVEIGEFIETGNPKSFLTEHTMMVRLTFENLDDFRIYEKHPIHLASIKDTQDLMAGPPIGYDYIVK